MGIFPYLCHNIHKDLLKLSDLEGTGISVFNTFTTTDEAFEKLKISGNIIRGMETGVHCIQQNSLWPFKKSETLINNNEVFMNFDITHEATSRHGILAEKCDGIKIVENTVNGYYLTNTSGVELRGIRIVQSPGSWVSHNLLQNLNTGIHTNGNLLNTQFPCNVFSDTYSGFLFGPGTALTNQHIAYQEPSGLDFYCTNNYFGNGFAAPPNLRMRQNAPNDIVAPFNWFYDPNAGANYQLDADLINTTAHPCYSHVLPQTDIDPYSICGYIVSKTGKFDIDSLTRDYLFVSIASGSISYDSLIDQNQFFEKDYLFNQLLRNPAMIQMGTPADSIYADFYDSIKATDPELIQRVYDMIKTYQKDSASYYNNMITGVDEWIQNRKNANSLFLGTWGTGNYTIPSSDSITGAAIAKQTPYKAGDGVYTYRVMLNMLDHEFYGTPYRVVVATESEKLLKVSPNPTTGSFVIELTGKSDQPVLIEIYSLAGEVISKQKFSDSREILQISTEDLPSGCYIIKASNENRILGHAKLSVIH